MDNTTAPPLTGGLLLVTQIELVTPTTVAGTLYGIAFTLFCLYIHALAPQLRNGDRTRQTKFMLAYSTLIMICGMYFLISNAWVMQDAYIKHSNYPGGPFAYEQSNFLTTPVIPIGLACQLVVDILTLAIQIWRVWVIWNATRYTYLVTVPLALCLLTFAGLRLRTIVVDTTVSVQEAAPLDTITVEIAVQCSITILCTVLISVYLIFNQWRQRKLIGRSQGATGYMNVVAVIVESYALESIWLLTFAILWNRPAAAFFEETTSYIEVIAYLLVQYRVARGKAYESQRERRNISTLRWNHSNHATTRFGETGEIHDSNHAATMPEVPSVPQVSVA